MAVSRKAKSGKAAPAKRKTVRRKVDNDVEVPVPMRKRNRPEYGSDAVAEILNGFGFDYAFLNPGSSYRSLQDSLVNYNGNVRPKVVL
ncbi:MAG: hypothetical protein AB7P12_13665, partial [Alphaproteobacteria bacterium]